MGFLSVLRPIAQTWRAETDGAGPDQAVAAPWTLLPGDSTPTDVALDTNIMFANTTLVSSPELYYLAKEVPVLGAGLRCSADIRVASLPFPANTNVGARLAVFQPSQGTTPTISVIPLSLLLQGNAGSDTNSELVLRWGSTSTTVTLGDGFENAFFRIGWEIIPRENIVRGYLNSTASTPSETANQAGMTVRAEIAFDNPGTVLMNGPFHIGTAFSNTSSVAPSGAVPNFSGIDMILVEEFVPEPFTAVFPGGSYFPVPVQTAYTQYKSQSYLYDLFTKARFS